MYTFQDFERDKSDLSAAINSLLREHAVSHTAMTAREADLYDRQINPVVNNYARYLYNVAGQQIIDRTSSNNHLCSNFFRRLNTQRMTYSLGNGISFDEDGIKERLGSDFDTVLRTAGYYALIHGVSFLFWNVDHAHIFPVTEFAPLWDEETGALMAGLRYWQIDAKKPVMAVLYEVDGYTKLRGDNEYGSFEVVEEKRPYRYKTMKSPADDEPEIVGEENYSSLPIIPLYGSRLKQSTLIGMRELLNAHDLILSGYANDLQDCSEIYWIVGNAGGMDDNDLMRFRDRLKLHHIANVADADEVTVTPYTQEIPSASRTSFLDQIRARIYEDFGGLDVHTIAAGDTNDHIDAAYQPLDENADDFEYEVIDTVHHLLRLMDIDATPIFKRNRISNQREQAEMVLLAANYLDDETILKKMPFLTPDEVSSVMERKEAEEADRFTAYEDEEDEDIDE